MSTDLFSRYGSLLKADGTNQLQRTLPALEEGYIRPDERSLSDLVAYARKVAQEVSFYNRRGHKVGDWRALVEPLLADVQKETVLPPSELEAAIAKRHDWPPHLALFLTFLELFRHLQNDLNELPQKHLRHYYEQVLALARRDATADDVHVIFEMARNAASTRLPAGTVLDAGKDAEGRSLTYETGAGLVVSAAEVKQLRRLVADPGPSGKRRFFGAAAVSKAEGTSWHTFGRRQLALAADARFMAEARIGFAIAGPILELAEGKRIVKIKARLEGATGAGRRRRGIGFALDPTLTGAEGWVEPDSFTASLVSDGGSTALEIDLTLSAAAPAIVPFDAKLHGAGPVSKWPVLRCLLRGEAGQYETLRGLTVDRIELTATVEGLRDLVVQNDQGPLTPDQPMPLFGSQPRIGSRFYVGSTEVFGKKLSWLALHLEWQDAPKSLHDHYELYFDKTHTNLTDAFDGQFVAGLDLLYDRAWTPLRSKLGLFGKPSDLVVGDTSFAQAFEGRTYEAQPNLEEAGSYTIDSRFGFARVVLGGPSRSELESYASKVPFEAFGHEAYPRRYAMQAIALSKHKGSNPPELPNEPYTPTLAGLSLDYTAGQDVSVDDRRADHKFFVVDPWGYTQAGGEIEARLVPEFDPEQARDDSRDPFQAALFVGLKDLVPPANVSLLFQMDSGTATAAKILEPGEAEWAYLSGGGWKALPPQAVLNDSTFGFQEPGLVVLSLGSDATTRHTTMPSGLVWLRALIRRPPESVSRTRAVRAQAAQATFSPATGAIEEYEEHLQGGLAAESIKRLQKQNAAIKKVSQPYASFAGRTAEQDADFFRRCSERLRHRGRAVTAWDFERLVLEEFPDVFKVKCLPHSDRDGNDAAGEAALVIVPDLRRATGGNVLEPRAGAVMMARIERFVATGLTSPYAQVHVIHPRYERILVEARVALERGLDAGYHANLLDQELQRFLSPWGFDEGQDIVFGARIYRSEVLAFVEGRKYVDYVTDFNLYHIYEGPVAGGIRQMRIGTDFLILSEPRPALPEMTIGVDYIVGRGVEVAAATRPHAILVSHPRHRILPLKAGEDVCTGVQMLGIGDMTVGIDLEVHQD